MTVIPRLRPWDLSSGAPEAYCCHCSSGSKVRKRNGIGGLTSQLLLLVPLRGPNVGGQCSSCRFASPPPARAPAHFRFRTRARTAAATVFLRSCGPGQRGHPPVVGGGRPFSCHSGRSPLSFRAQSRNLSPADTFQPPCSNRLILKRLQNISWKVPRKNMPPSRLGFANYWDSITSKISNGRWRRGCDPRAAKQKKQAGAGRE